MGEDWPLGYDELEPYYARAERALGVSGADDNPFASPRRTPYPLAPFPWSHADHVMKAACERLGIVVHRPSFARSSAEHEGRPRCQAFGTCASARICPIGAQYTAETHVALAERTGHATVVSDAPARRLEVDASGRVRSVTVVGPDGRPREYRARAFVLAAHAVESARLLLLSASGRFPDGLANGSGMVGRHFMEHPFVSLAGRAPMPVYPYRIGFHTAETHQFAIGAERARASAFRLAFLNQVGPSPAGLARRSGLWGAALAAEIRQEFGRDVGIHAFVEQLPDPRNTVTLDPAVKDSFGDPAPRITFGVSGYEREGARRAFAVMSSILDAVGATHVHREFGDEFGWCGHQIGTCRMGNDPRRSVVDRELRAHDVPNLSVVGSSVFPTAGPLNPSLTIVALAIRLADSLVRRGGA